MRTQMLINKPVYLGLWILDLKKSVMFEFWCDSVKPKYGENAKLCYADADSFIVHMKTEDTYKDCRRFWTRFYTSSVDRPLSRGKNKKGQIMKEFVGLSAKIYNYLKSNSYEDKRAKGTKICVINRKRKLYRLWKLFRTSSNWK